MRPARPSLHGLASEPGADEVRVLGRIAERLKAGETTDGPICLAVDPREFRAKGAREKVEDALV